MLLGHFEREIFVVIDWRDDCSRNFSWGKRSLVEIVVARDIKRAKDSHPSIFPVAFANIILGYISTPQNH